jgi:hypothetical protein
MPSINVSSMFLHYFKLFKKNLIQIWPILPWWSRIRYRLLATQVEERIRER